MIALAAAFCPFLSTGFSENGTVTWVYDHFSRSTVIYQARWGWGGGSYESLQRNHWKTTPGCHQGHPTHEPTSACFSWRCPHRQEKHSQLISGKKNARNRTHSEMIYKGGGGGGWQKAYKLYKNNWSVKMIRSMRNDELIADSLLADKILMCYFQNLHQRALWCTKQKSHFINCQKEPQRDGTFQGARISVLLLVMTHNMQNTVKQMCTICTIDWECTIFCLVYSPPSRRWCLWCHCRIWLTIWWSSMEIVEQDQNKERNTHLLIILFHSINP